MKKWLIIILLLPGLSLANDSNDLRDFTDLWLVDYNFVDFASFADSWTGPMPVQITAEAINTTAITYTLQSIQLSAAGGKADLQYVISSEPNNGYLIDIDFVLNSRGSLQPNRLNLPIGFNRIDATPYRLKRKGSTVYYYCTDTNSTAFNYYAIDGYGQSDEAAVNISSKTDHPRDCLSLSGGKIEINDHNAIEFDDSFTFTAWLRCDQDYCSILKKRAATGPGVQLSIRAGRLRFEVWDTNDNYGDLRAWIPLEKDGWFFVAVTADINGTQLYIDGVQAIDSDILPAGPYSNDANLVISGFAGDIDRFSFWEHKSDFSIALIATELRDGPGGGVLVPVDYICRWDCNETSGTTITDSKLSLVGNITGSFSWLPDAAPKRKQRIQFFKLGAR